MSPTCKVTGQRASRTSVSETGQSYPRFYVHLHVPVCVLWILSWKIPHGMKIRWFPSGGNQGQLLRTRAVQIIERFLGSLAVLKKIHFRLIQNEKISVNWKVEENLCFGSKEMFCSIRNKMFHFNVEHFFTLKNPNPFLIEKSNCFCFKEVETRCSDFLPPHPPRIV